MDTTRCTVRVVSTPSCPAMRRFSMLLERLQRDGPAALGDLLASGITMDYFVTDPVTGRFLPYVAKVLFCTIFAKGPPAHEELLEFAGAAGDDCVLPACLLAEAPLAKKVIAQAVARGRPVGRAAVRALVVRRDGIQPDEIGTMLPGHETSAYVEMLESGRFEAARVARSAAECDACDMAAIFDALIMLREHDVAREVAPMVDPKNVRATSRVAHDLMCLLTRSEKRLAKELLFGIAHGRRAL